jgi:hypothetical protein
VSDAPAVTADYAWHPEPAPDTACQDWVIFRRTFRLDAEPDSATLHLFASTRYRLTVNGTTLGEGPIRFAPGLEEHDRYDLTPNLIVGENCIEVVACDIRFNNFQHNPEPTGRFIAWGTIHGNSETINLHTPGDWRAHRSDARSQAVPSFSFAIGPIEHLDLRQATPDDHDWQRPTRVEPPATSPATPPHRSIPYPTGERSRPAPLLLADVQPSGLRFGYIAVHPSSRSQHLQPTRDTASRYVACVHSPEPQQVTLRCHWGPHWLNGQPLKPTDVPGRHNLQHATLDLRAGWNLLAGEPQQLQPRYPVLLGLPADAGLTVRSRPHADDPHVIRHLPPAMDSEAASWSNTPPAAPDDLDLDDPTWIEVPLDAAEPHTPARLMAWDTLSPREPADLPIHRTAGDGPFTVVLDAGGEFLGHIGIRATAPPGTRIQIGYDERRRDDGSLNWFASNPFTDTADQFVVGDGPCDVETYLPRGGRYLQVTVRPPEAPADAPVHLDSVTLRDARCLPRFDKSCPSDDPLHRWLWDTGVATLAASTEDVYCDSPWRERGAYLGDSYVQSMVEMVTTDDHRIGRRCLRLFAASQLDDGQIPCVMPGWYAKPHGDFTLIYTLWLHDYWLQTGDDELGTDCLPTVDRLLASPTWRTSDHSPLWDAAPQNRLFIDWGVHKPLRTWPENGVLNALRIEALRRAADLHDELDDTRTATANRRLADELTTAYRQRLWLPDTGRFAGGTDDDGQPIPDEVIHPNILALAYGLADEQQRGPLTDYVVSRMQTNADKAMRAQQHDDHAELYYLMFALKALHRVGRADIAEQVVSDHYQPLRDGGAWTLWECLCRGIDGRGSLCHSWSAAGLLHIAGQVWPGDPSTLIRSRQSA